MAKNVTSGPILPEFDIWSPTNQLGNEQIKLIISLSLSFAICKMVIILIPNPYSAVRISWPNVNKGLSNVESN